MNPPEPPALSPFGHMFHASPVAASLSTLAEGRLLDFNAPFLALIGRSRDEALGRTGLELNLWPRPELRQRLLHQLRAAAPGVRFLLLVDRVDEQAAASSAAEAVLLKGASPAALVGALERLLRPGTAYAENPP